ncbi:MAG: glycosyltransferase [Fulvivirga sp.]|uniref:glycosyltransferase n=1 Tax=Fulvivirga sp. TaxID=1931237 RepID=UPI0032EF43A6
MIDTFVLIFIALSTIQALFYGLFLIKITSFKKNTAVYNEGVSVVIATKNGMPHLVQLLESLVKQEYAAFEIIVVNDRSSDETKDYLLEAVKQYQNLKVVTVEHKPNNMDGKKYALTLGIKAAKYNNILLTDNDCLPASNQWIKEMASGFGQHQTQIVVGVSLYESKPGLLNSFIQYESLWTAIQYVSFQLFGMPYMGVGRNLAYKRELFLTKKGFSGYMERTGGDDDLFVNKHATKSNTSLVIGEGSLVYSIPKSSWRAFFNQKLRHISVGKLYRIKHKIVLSILSLTHISFWLSFLMVMVYNPLNYIVLSCFTIRTLLLYLTFRSGSHKFGKTFSMWGLLFLDFIFVFYYLSTGLRAIFTKKVRWS